MNVSGAGKRIRSARLVDEVSGRGLIVPIDHGLTMGPIEGIETIASAARWLHSPAINGVIGHKGTIERLGHMRLLHNQAVVVHLNGMTNLGEQPDTKQLLVTVEAAIRLGADAVSVQVNFRHDNHGHNLRLLSTVEESAARYGLPMLAMVYDKVHSADDDLRIKRQRHLIRVAIELGVDIIKTDPPRQSEHIEPLLDGIADDAAIFFSGGSLMAEDELIDLAKRVSASAAKGLCVGRNVFQRPDPLPMLANLRQALNG